MTDDHNADLMVGLRGAVESLRIHAADEDAVSILNWAARLSPDDAQPPISTTRLAGAVAIGNALASERTFTPLRSYAVALAEAVAKNSDPQARYEKNIAALFKTESAKIALARLRPQWFSTNVSQILIAAASEVAGAPLSGDAIVRSMRKYRDGDRTLTMRPMPNRLGGPPTKAWSQMAMSLNGLPEARAPA